MTTQCLITVTVILQYDAIKIRHNTLFIKPYKYDINVEDINPEDMCDNVNI